MSKLVIVESPSKAKSIQKYLGKDYTVVSSKGHVRDLPAAKLSVDVKNDFAPKYAVIKGKEKLVKELKELADNSDAVILAADPDREGEAISWHLATLLGLDLNENNRVKFNEINKNSVIKGIEKPEKIDLDLVNAQQARRILDRLVGYTLSPFISQKIRRGLSAGRVQSVAVRLVVDRENEIRAFNPEEYWTLDAQMLAPSSKKAFKAQFLGDETGKVKITNKEQSDMYLARLEGADFVATSVKKGVRNRQPAPPFTTSTLQQEASRKLNFQARRTMKVAQELYEGVEIQGVGSVGLITYMRTDSLRISEEARAAGNDYIRNTFGADYLPEKPRYYKTKANAQDGHEAIRPTMMDLTPERVKASLSAEQYKLYNLIWKRFMASLMANCVQDTVKAEIQGANASDKAQGKFITFSASGYSVRFDGYTCLYESGTDEEDVIYEAKLLGLDDAFEGGIHGAHAAMTECSKELVIRDMLEKENIKPHEMVSFGDGYVEVLLVDELGGLAIGAATEEEKRCGINEWKRNRLITAGAKAIIPDFRDAEEILKLIRG